MYEAIDTRTHAVYRGQTVAELRDVIEAEMDMPTDLPIADWYNWSPSRAVKWLIQAGYLLPQDGPEWFMQLAPPQHPEDLNSPRSVRPRTAFIKDDGSVTEGYTGMTFWLDRNHVRLVFRDMENILGEVFITEESARLLWVALGKLIGFDEDALRHVISHLPAAQIYNPGLPPQRMKIDDSPPSSQSGFDIFRAISELDIGLDDLPDGGGEE